MSIKGKDRKARKAYKKKIETVRVELYPTDEDIKARIAERLEAGEKKATYIKRLIRFDIQLHKALVKALQIPLQMFNTKLLECRGNTGKICVYDEHPLQPVATLNIEVKDGADGGQSEEIL